MSEYLHITLDCESHLGMMGENDVLVKLEAPYDDFYTWIPIKLFHYGKDGMFEIITKTNYVHNIFKIDKSTGAHKYIDKQVITGQQLYENLKG